MQIQNPEMEVSENTNYIERRETWEKKVYMSKYILTPVSNGKCFEIKFVNGVHHKDLNLNILTTKLSFKYDRFSFNQQQSPNLFLIRTHVVSMSCSAQWN